MRLRKIVFVSLLTVLIIVILTFLLFSIYIYLIPVDINSEKLDKLEVSLSLYDKNNKKIEQKIANYVKYEDIPKNLINAFIAIEDKRFFKHKGVDYIRILGALKNNLINNTTQGGSTITQQLAKNMFLSLDKSYDRKIKEIRLAINIEKIYSKEEILEKYLNMLYFGSGEYGIKNAAKRFFSKSLDELNLKECALLAGIVKSPTKYNPILNYENSITRSCLVLKLMREQNFITDDEYKIAKKCPIVIKNDLIYNNIVSKYSNSVYFEAAKILGVDLYELPYMDLKIQTMFDFDEQKRLFEIMNNKDYFTLDGQKALAIIIDNKTSCVSAFYSNFNMNIFDFKRSPASTIKPLVVFGPALNDHSYHLFTKINNTKQNFNNYSPKNYNNYYSDYETLKDCLIYSYNNPACNILNNIGINSAKAYLEKLNLDYTQNDLNLSLALGGMHNGINLLNLCAAYTTFANDGLFNKGSFINKILDKNNKVIYSKKQCNTRVYSKETANLITMSLAQCAKYGTANKLNKLNFDIASKTGTVSLINKDYNSDAYNIAYTSDVTSLFWTGDDVLDSSISGGGVTTLMAKDFYLNKYLNNKPKDFIYSNKIKEIDLDLIHYMNNNYYLADNLSPKTFRFKTVIDSTKNNLDYDYSYSNIDNLNALIKDDHLTINLNPRLCYTILERKMFIEKEIADIKNSDNILDLKINDNAQYIIIPYYYDDKNTKIIGLPYKYGNSFSILDIDV